MAPFGELFKQSWELYKKKIGVLAIFFAIPFVINIISYLVTPRTTTSGTSLSTVNPFTPAAGSLALLFGLVAFVVSLWIQVGVVYAVDDPDNHPPIQELLAKAWPLVLPYLLVAILVGLAVIGGLILLIVPGIIFAVWFSLSSFTLILDNQRGTAALKASKGLVSGRFGAVFGRFLLLILTFIGIAIVGGIVIAILPGVLKQIGSSALSNFVLSPLGLIFTYLLYKELKSKSAAPAAVTPATPPAVPVA